MPRDRQSIVSAERRNLRHRRPERGVGGRGGGGVPQPHINLNGTHSQRSDAHICHICTLSPAEDTSRHAHTQARTRTRRSEVTCTRCGINTHTHTRHEGFRGKSPQKLRATLRLKTFKGVAAASASGSSANGSSTARHGELGAACCLPARGRDDGGKKEEEKEEVESC